jgi:hypothetical protein
MAKVRSWKMRARVYRRARWRCENCGAKWPNWFPRKKRTGGSNPPLEIHHRDHNDDNNAFGNLQALCPPCHTYHHGPPRFRCQKVYEKYTAGFSHRPKYRKWDPGTMQWVPGDLLCVHVLGTCDAVYRG